MKEMKTNDVGGRDRLAGSHHSGWEIRITTTERGRETDSTLLTRGLILIRPARSDLVSAGRGWGVRWEL